MIWLNAIEFLVTLFTGVEYTDDDNGPQPSSSDNLRKLAREADALERAAKEGK